MGITLDFMSGMIGWSSGTTGIVATVYYLLTEGGDYLLTETGHRLIME